MEQTKRIKNVCRLQGQEFRQEKEFLKMKGYCLSGKKHICAIMESVNDSDETIYIHWMNPGEEETFRNSDFFKNNKPLNYFKLFGCKERTHDNAMHNIYKMLDALNDDEYSKEVYESKVKQRLNRLLESYGTELIKSVIETHRNKLHFACNLKELKDLGI